MSDEHARNYLRAIVKDLLEVIEAAPPLALAHWPADEWGGQTAADTLREALVATRKDGEKA